MEKIIEKIAYDIFKLGFDAGYNLDKPISHKKLEKYNETKKAHFDSYLKSTIPDKIRAIQQKYSKNHADSIVEIVSLALNGYKVSGDVKKSARVAFMEYYNQKGVGLLGDHKFKIEKIITEEPNLTIEIDKFISKLTAKKLSKITGKEEDAILENFSKHFGMEYSSVIFSLIQRISYCIAKKLFEIKKNKEV